MKTLNQTSLLLAGEAGGYWKTGQHLNYIQTGPADVNNPTYQYAGVAHNQLCETLLQAMGLQPADYQKYQAQGTGFGPYNGTSTTAIKGILPKIRG